MCGTSRKLIHSRLSGESLKCHTLEVMSKFRLELLLTLEAQAERRNVTKEELKSLAAVARKKFDIQLEIYKHTC